MVMVWIPRHLRRIFGQWPKHLGFQDRSDWMNFAHHNFTRILTGISPKTWNPRRNLLQVDGLDSADVDMAGAEEAATVTAADSAVDAETGVAVSFVFDSFAFWVCASFRYLTLQQTGGWLQWHAFGIYMLIDVFGGTFTWLLYRRPVCSSQQALCQTAL